MSAIHKYRVEGINCINCSNAIKNHLAKKKISQVYIDISKNTVIIKNNEYSRSEIQTFLLEIGYKSVSYSNLKTLNHKLEYRLIISIILCLPFCFNILFSEFNFLFNPLAQLLFSSIILMIGLEYFGWSALKSILNGKTNMNVLILIGAFAAYLYSIIGGLILNNDSFINNYLFFETTAIIITLVLLGNYFEKYSISQTTTAIDGLQKMQVKTAVKFINGKIDICTISDLNIGDIIIVNEGESIPIDGEIIWGKCLLDESMISGESSPVFKSIGENVLAGTILIQGNIKCKVNKDINETVLSQIINLVRDAQNDKPKIQQLGDKISNYFVPFVMIISGLTFIINFQIFDIDFQNSMLRSIAVLVISCPCAMGLATPTAIMVGVGRAAKNSLLIKGGSTIELFSKTKKIIFDKTGTLTNGEFKIHELKKWNKNYDAESIIYSLEKHSSHPIAKSLTKHLEKHKKDIQFTSTQEIKGMGVFATDIKGNTYQFGSPKFTKILDPKIENKFQLFLKINQELIAAISMSDDIKYGAKKLMNYFKNQQIDTVLMSGDIPSKCNLIAQKINIKEVYANQMPEDKIEKIKTFSKEKNTSMFGDGINDAPALTKAQVGISYSNASEIAVQSASIVLLKHNLELVSKAHQICKHTYLTIKQNLFWAFAYNIIAIPLASMGYLNPIFATLTMAFSDIIVIGNSIRLKYKNIDS